MEKLHTFKSHLQQLRYYNNLLKGSAENMKMITNSTAMSVESHRYKLLYNYKWMQLQMIINRNGIRTRSYINHQTVSTTGLND